MFRQDASMKESAILLGQCITRLSICYQHLSARFTRVLDPLGLNMTRMSVLSHLSRRPEESETISSLVEKMEMNQPVLTKAVNAMQDNGWIEKRRDDNDGRITHLLITPLGMQQLAAGQQACLPIMQDAFGDLSTAELEALLKLLSKVKI